jgi:hypothetical protein
VVPQVSRSQLFGKQGAGPVFRGAVPKRDHAAYQGPSQPQVVQYVPFFVIVVLRLTQMPWKLVVLVEQMQAGGTLGGEVGAPPEAPWKLVSENLMQMLQPVHLVVVIALRL